MPLVLTEELEEQAALYAAGTLTPLERTQFELILHFNKEAQEFTDRLVEVAAAATRMESVTGVQPDPGLKECIMAMLDDRVQITDAESFVMAGPDGLVQFVNEPFTAMCGYTPAELLGKKLGPLLQGRLTDLAAVGRIRAAVREQKPVTEALINYHKDGSPYWVCLNITPLFRPSGKLLCFIARERKLPEREIPVEG